MTQNTQIHANSRRPQGILRCLGGGVPRSRTKCRPINHSKQADSPTPAFLRPVLSQFQIIARPLRMRSQYIRTSHFNKWARPESVSQSKPEHRNCDRHRFVLSLPVKRKQSARRQKFRCPPPRRLTPDPTIPHEQLAKCRCANRVTPTNRWWR